MRFWTNQLTVKILLLLQIMSKVQYYIRFQNSKTAFNIKEQQGRCYQGYSYWYFSDSSLTWNYYYLLNSIEISSVFSTNMNTFLWTECRFSLLH